MLKYLSYRYKRYNIRSNKFMILDVIINQVFYLVSQLLYLLILIPLIGIFFITILGQDRAFLSITRIKIYRFSY